MNGFSDNAEDLALLRFVCRDGDTYTTMMYARANIADFMAANLFTDEFVIYLPVFSRAVVKETIIGNCYTKLTKEHLRVADFLMLRPFGIPCFDDLETTEDVELACRMVGPDRTFISLVDGCWSGSVHFNHQRAAKMLRIAPDFPSIMNTQFMTSIRRITLAIITGKPEYARGATMMDAKLCIEMFPEIAPHIS